MQTNLIRSGVRFLHYTFHLACGPGHLAGPVPPAIDPGAVKHLPAPEVVRVECDAALAVGLAVRHLSIVDTELQLQPLL